MRQRGPTRLDQLREQVRDLLAQAWSKAESQYMSWQEVQELVGDVQAKLNEAAIITSVSGRRRDALNQIKSE